MMNSVRGICAWLRRVHASHSLASLLCVSWQPLPGAEAKRACAQPTQAFDHEFWRKERLREHRCVPIGNHALFRSRSINQTTPNSSG